MHKRLAATAILLVGIVVIGFGPATVAVGQPGGPPDTKQGPKAPNGPIPTDLTCVTCHDPHSGRTDCTTCHTTTHGTEPGDPPPIDSDADCATCHTVTHSTIS